MPGDMGFGRVLRKARKKAGKTLGDVAGFLGFKVSYISDIEHGRKAPWPSAIVVKLAAFLQADELEMLRAAAQSKGTVELDATHASRAKLRLGAALARSWSNLSDERAAQIHRALDPKYEE